MGLHVTRQIVKTIGAFLFLTSLDASALEVAPTDYYTNGSPASHHNTPDEVAIEDTERYCNLPDNQTYTSCGYLGLDGETLGKNYHYPDSTVWALYWVSLNGTPHRFGFVYKYKQCPSGFIFRTSSSTGLTMCWKPDPTPPQPPTPCPVEALTPITDPIALEHEEGQYSTRPDLDRLTQSTRTGAECIVQRSASNRARARITSGFRPAAYQTHLREVWDKWQLLRNNSTVACQAIKDQVREEWNRHALVRQPGRTSRHSTGRAIDAGGVPENNADRIAAQCSMRRPLGDDRVHYEPR